MLCVSFPDVEFVPDPSLGQDSLPAKNVCAHCADRTSCLERAIGSLELGVWGGTNELDRLMMVTTSKTRTCRRCGSKPVITPLGTVCLGCGHER